MPYWLSTLERVTIILYLPPSLWRLHVSTIMIIIISVVAKTDNLNERYIKSENEIGLLTHVIVSVPCGLGSTTSRSSRGMRR